MNFITQDTEIPIYTKQDMIKFRASTHTLYEFTLWEKKPLEKKVTIPAILKICCYVAQVAPQEVQFKSRKAEIVFARQTAHFFSALLTEETLEKIGKKIGGRDHSTVIYSIKNIRTATDPQWKDKRREKIMLIARLIKEKYRIDTYAYIKYDRENPDRNEKMYNMGESRFQW